MENLKTHKKLGIVQATGTGKGKLASCFVEHVLKRKPNAKILILAPLHTILDNYRDNFGLTDSDVSFMAYSGLLKFDDTYLINLGLTYDLVIVDEFHRLGGQEWGRCIKAIFKGVDNPKSTSRVIGFTATPIRYLDNSRDMGAELFDDNIIQGISLEDAICEGILPGFVYNACYFSTEDKLALVEKKLASNDYKIVDDTIRNDLMVKVKELRMLYHNKLKIENILRETTKDLGTTQKWIIFCRDKDSLDEIREICKSWFVSVPSLYVIHSDKYRADNRRILKEFRESKSGINVMLCIDMLNEGVHIKDIDGIIMLRKTDSPIIFLQQLGRALEAGKTTQPLIYDLVGNYKDLRIENSDGLVGNTISIVKGIADKVNKKRSSNSVIVHNFVEDFDNVMAELSQYVAGRPWGNWEDNIIFNYYQEVGPKGCQEKGLHRTYDAISSRALYLGAVNRRDWLKEEDDIVFKYYQVGGADLCIEKGLTNRKRSAIMKRASDLGLNVSRYWRSWEDDIVKKYFPTGGSKACIDNGLSHRSKASLKSRAQVLGIRYEPIKWSPELDNIIAAYYPEGGADLCIENGLTMFSKLSIQRRAQELGIRGLNPNSWKSFEDDILNRYYEQGGPDLCIEKGLNRSKAAIAHRASYLGLKRNSIKKAPKGVKIGLNGYPSYDDLIIKYYPEGGAKLCIKMGVDMRADSIHRRASKIGLKRTSNWGPNGDDILYKYYTIGGYKLCQEMGLKKSKDSIVHRANKLGLKVIKS